MVHILDITGDDIALLDDTDLRTLIGLLCEADYRSAGLPTKDIIWGGHQDAPDGGLDVVVKGTILPPPNSSIPRSETGFQVKKSDMPKRKIIDEMKPKGVFRDDIRNLADKNGAYIIVSSNGSTTSKALKSRIDAMKEAVRGELNEEDIFLDFYDRGRIATWIRSHPSLVLWVRGKIGKSLFGWHPYENWANPPGGTNEEYLLDEEMRLDERPRSKDGEMSIKDGLERLRKTLSNPGSSVRLTGLSGVGKTRLVQALFDDRVGQNALNPSQAIYTDTADSPSPAPLAFAESIKAEKKRAILIVDNCPPDLHRRLTKTCYTSDVSILTVEYDIREDIPEETRVFILKPSSEKVIEQLIRNRFTQISHVNARTIGEFSGGNARVAIALAHTVERGETLSGFSDEDLFERLFRQRHDSNTDLLVSAEACSLVYSFEGTDVDSEASEILLLASLIGKSAAELYRDVAKLGERGLIQSRGQWRALLPHAIANWLAKRALKAIPKQTITQSILGSGSERLIKSFTRRLSYLDGCEPAVEIANDWLSEHGWIGEANCNFSDFGMEVFKNLAPVSPEKALELIERAAKLDHKGNLLSRENAHFYDFVLLLRHIAYDQELFDRSVRLILPFAISENPDEKYYSTRNVLKSLFSIYLSGTRASIESRASIIEKLVGSDDSDSQEIGLFLLDATLETYHFISAYEFEFGARSRDFGYVPRTNKEVMGWYQLFIGICTRLALSGRSIAQRARKILCIHFRGLWTNAGMFRVLEEEVARIHQQQPLNECWAPIKETLKYDGGRLEKDSLAALNRLEKLLRPSSLIERARTFALSSRYDIFCVADDSSDSPSRSQSLNQTGQNIREIGTEVAQDMDTLELLLPELVSKYAPGLHSFGLGLADGCQSKKELWQKLVSQLRKTPRENRVFNVFMGFLASCAETDPEFCNATLDAMITDDLMSDYFPILQTAVPIDKEAVERLRKALDYGRAKPETFGHIAQVQRHKSICDDDLADLLDVMLSREDGIYVVIQILKMRFHDPDTGTNGHSTKLISVAHKVLSTWSFFREHRKYGKDDHGLAQLSKNTLDFDYDEYITKKLCHNFIKAFLTWNVHAHDYPELLSVIAAKRPVVFLDIFIEEYDIGYEFHRRLSYGVSNIHENPLNHIPDSTIISWCKSDPECRYCLIVTSLQLFIASDETAELKWRPIFFLLLSKAPDLGAVLSSLDATITPLSWSGSLADVLQKRLVLFESLYEHDDAKVRTWAKAQYLALQQKIEVAREGEDRRNRADDLTFE